MKRSRLFRKTLLLMFLLFGVISISSSLLSAWVLRDMMTREFISKGKAIARSVAMTGAELVLHRDPSTVQSIIDQYLDIASVRYVFVRDGHGVIISHTFVPQVPREVDHLEEDPETLSLTRLHIEGEGEVMDISAPILAGAAGFVHVGMDMGVVRGYIINTILKMQGLMFFIFWGSVAILYMVVNRIARPLNILSEYASKLAQRDWSATVDIPSRDEVGMLADTMSFMARELSELVSNLEQEVETSAGERDDTLAYLRAIVDNMADGLLVVDMDGRITHANPVFKQLFDMESMELGGVDVDGVFHSDVLALVQETAEDFQGVKEAEINLPRGRTGKAAATAIHAGRHGDIYGDKRLGTVILFRDITLEKEVDEMKTEFISTVSHELRTPLTSILGFAKVIGKRLAAMDRDSFDRDMEQIRGNMDIIVSEGTRLGELINDVLDIAKMESGKLEWGHEPVDIGEVIRHTARSIEPVVLDKGLSVTFRIENDLPRIMGDRDRLVQVMVNLLSNAVKFTHQGRITCMAYLQGPTVEVVVEDTGVGIAPEDQDAVFDRFRQVGNVMTDKPRGTGLGLPICREIVEYHGGTIRVESAPGEGSRFIFRLPFSDGDVGETPFRP